MINKTTRILDYFTVIGVGKKLTPNNPEDEPGKFIINRLNKFSNHYKKQKRY
jgi:hypothetical protein